MENTLETLERWRHKKKTKDLVERIHKATNNKKYPEVLSAPIQVIVDTHIGMVCDIEDEPSGPVINSYLTELLRTIRRVHEYEILEIIEDED